MKKVININFQGRVIPIEESAFEMLNEYINSLKVYFSREEGKDEIINDIESRIAELFSEELKKGSSCITDADVDKIISGMGRPSDFEAESGESASSSYTTENTGQYSGSQDETHKGKGRLYRNGDDKIVGGVCSGLANYINIDPVIMRILFVVFIGALFWVYILLWIIVPSKSIQSNITKRLYRNPEKKVFGGVAGGLAAYFNIDAWIPRLIFASPLLLAFITGTIGSINWWGWGSNFFPGIFFSGSLVSTMFVTYLILWIAVPMATTASEKLEMRGEKIDLNSIRDTVQEDLGSMKGRAEKFSGEVRKSAAEFNDKAREMGSEAGEKMKSFAAEAGPVVRRAGSGLGNVIGILFKALFLFIAGIVAIVLFALLISVLFGSFAVYPFKDFFLDGFTENLLLWVSVLLVIGLPVIAIITWIIRRIVGVRSKNNYIGYVFGTLWIIGFIAMIALMGMVGKDFRVRVPVEQEVTLSTPIADKIHVGVYNYSNKYYNAEWFGIDDDIPVLLYQDSMLLNNVRLNIQKSRDSSYRVYKVVSSRGPTSNEAGSNAEKIIFDIHQHNNIISLPSGFPISKEEKFRNQQVMVVVEVPVGGKIEVDRAVNDYSWFNINTNRRGWRFDDDDWDNFSYRWRTGVEYIMTTSGLERSGSSTPSSDGPFRGSEPSGKDTIRDTRYRYDSRISMNSSSRILNETSVRTETEEHDDNSETTQRRFSSPEVSTPLSVFSRLFQ